jgi:putative endonuclease
MLLADACVATAVFSESSVVYFLRLRSGQLYIGSTTDLHQRLKDHTSGRACRTTALNPPVALLRLESFPIFSQARHREAQLKRWSRAKKEALLRGDLPVLRTFSRSRVAPPSQTRQHYPRPDAI